MVLPLLLAGPTGRGETLEDLIAEHERQVNIIRQSIGRESKEAHVQDSEPDAVLSSQQTESSRRSRLTKLYDAIPSQQPLLLKSRVKKMVSHSNLTSPSPRTAVCQEHQQERNRDFKPGPTNPRSPIDTASRVTVANEQPLQSTCLVSSANSCHRPSLAGDGLSSLALSTPLFPATRAFRACAEVLVTPLGPEFFLDPLKLGSTKVLMASTSPVPTRGSSDGPVRILDLGGLDADPYTASLAAIPGCSVQKAILDPLRRKPHDAEFCDYTVHSTNSLASLPYPDACVDIVSARSLHKGVQYRLSGTDMAHNQELKDMRDCLAECHRLLVPGGRLEYIFFQDGLINTGPLTTEIEHFLKEVWGHKMEDGTSWARYSHLPRFDHSISTEEFGHILEEAGFQQGKCMATNFPLFTLSKLFDHAGNRRASPRGHRSSSVGIHRLHPQSPRYISGDVKARNLLAQVRNECELNQTGWKCLMGWVVKTAKPFAL